MKLKKHILCYTYPMFTPRTILYTFVSLLFVLLILSVLHIEKNNVFTFNQVFTHETGSLTEPATSTHKIILTETGFVPERIVIRVGDKIVFTTRTNRPFWPASSLHPTHEIYPEFDAKTPIKPDESYEFIFNKPGSWGYHDHIASHYTGTVYVLAAGEERVKASVTLDNNCMAQKEQAKTQCWDTQLKEIVRTKGADAGFNYLIAVYNAEPEVAKTCHEWVHVLGEAGYEVFAKGKNFQLRPETAWCSYGYFHGFMNAMIADTGSLEKVVEFCAMAVAQLQSSQPEIESNCLHGIGHVGVDLLFEKPEYWGNFQKTADGGFALCDKLFGSNIYLTECYGGVIHGLRFSMRNHLNGMSFESYVGDKDPYHYCRNQKAEHQMACYSDFASMFWEIFNGDIKAALTYIIDEHIADPAIINRTVMKATTAWVEFDLAKGAHKASVEACRTIPTTFFKSCMLGINIGFIQHGEPNNLHKKAFDFCRSDYLLEDEQKLCFTQIIELLRSEYSPKQFSIACETLTDTENDGQCF